ncbi:MAG TPA: 30S ribosomal protein S4 [Candidatus Nanoarchaeia archaeon]|nr:30S ribosomal protein S4 [Candidatus Nanoarchaeia archaeon]
MGDPRKIRKKYKGPGHPWKRDRLEAERVLKKEYGLKNKTELYKTESKLRRYTGQAKRLIKDRALAQAALEEHQLLQKLYRLCLVEEKAQLEDVLLLNVRNLLDRRLQTLVHKHNLSLTSKQARQFIVHGHVLVNNQKIDAPSYLVSRAEESSITFNTLSTLASQDHPERAKERKTKQAPSEEKKELVELKKVEEVVGAVVQ